MTRTSDVENFIEEQIGPRTVGCRYKSSYGDYVTVLEIDRNSPTWMLWSITEATDEELAAGTSRTHCTPWAYGRDLVVS